jgi:hypothetical protein
LWFANGAVFVTPACALVLFIWTIRHGGARALPLFLLLGVCALASFAGHFALTLRYTIGSQALQAYWAFALPPANGGVRSTIGWMYEQLASFAVKPGGVSLWAVFWIVAATGLAALAGTSPVLGVTLALVPASAFLLAAFRIVPLYERLSLWVVPALYVGIAASADAAFRLARHRFGTARWPGAILGTLAAAVVAVAVFDVGRQAAADLHIRLAQLADNHELDDRAGVRWLMARRQPDDVVVTTRLALPAVWWYGNAKMADPGGVPFANGRTPIVEAAYAQGPDCTADDLASVFAGHARALIYFGFRFDDVPPNFDDFLLDRASAFGSVTTYREFSTRSRAAVIDLRAAPVPAAAMAPIRPGGAPRTTLAAMNGCLHLKQATRW